MTKLERELDAAGFTLVEEIPRPPREIPVINAARRGKFYYEVVEGETLTVAFDESGSAWVRSGKVDLTIRGFEELGVNTI